ncbi:MAG: glycogen/starch/alpha-glucan phosphorylase [Deltaproteobacteria bacterium]|nr:glycogen/starch/alpha-glucan phosphorylase [Deltaproteobacteria bacterium]
MVDRKSIVVVEDDRTGMSEKALRRAVLDHLQFTRAKDLGSATLLDVYHALAHTVRDRLVHRWMWTQRTYIEKDVKRMYYLSAEYLLGRQLASNLLNLDLMDFARQGLSEYEINLEDVLEEEEDPGLGNGGLGRLAACFMDSLATLEYPAMGYGIRYEFGIFRQGIRDGWQLEQPDEWLRKGNPWEIARPEYTVEVKFGGRVEEDNGDNGERRMKWVGGETVLGVPYDTPVAGFGTFTVNTLRLWSSRASQQFDLKVFNDGDYRRAVERKALSESISKVLYPKDASLEGKELRLKQQYFFVCCSIHDILRRYKAKHSDFAAFPAKVAIQLNDTHPAIAIPELMRVLVDREHLGWEEAWRITRRTFAYTNHTLLPEALERWPLALLERLLPRHMQIIFEINRRFLRQVHVFAPKDKRRRERMSIIEEGPDRQVRMAYLSVVGAHTVNGVAALHSSLIREKVLKDFAQMRPKDFTNMTNGVTPRRWLLQCNPRLADAVTQRIGSEWITNLSQLERLLEYAEDPGFLQELSAIKQANKDDLAQWIWKTQREEVDPSTLFDVQVKRIHEYKRQVMVCLHVVHLYQRIKFGGEEIVPRTVLVGGKAAPGYVNAKLIIKLINDVAAMIRLDPAVGGRLKLLFLPNYNVSMAERIIPATDLSEQISMAGKEASGTGNMKFQMNGALTLGTLDGANVEIREEVGPENFFLFGLDAPGAQQLQTKGYSPAEYIERSPELQEALELIESGFFCPDEPDLHKSVGDYLRNHDPFLVCADFDAYRKCQEVAAQTWADPEKWWPMVARNIAKAGKFSSDRTIQDYATRIWGLEPTSVAVGIRGGIEEID